MSFYLRKSQFLVCCKAQGGKVKSKSFKHGPEVALQELCAATGLSPSAERRYDLLFEMAKELGVPFPKPDRNEDEQLQWLRQGMPGMKYECSDCQELLPTAICLAHHAHLMHGSCQTAEDCKAKISQRCEAGMLYFKDCKDLAKFIGNCKK